MLHGPRSQWPLCHLEWRADFDKLKAAKERKLWVYSIALVALVSLAVLLVWLVWRLARMIVRRLSGSPTVA
jgi:hypothetical protein